MAAMKTHETPDRNATACETTDASGRAATGASRFRDEPVGDGSKLSSVLVPRASSTREIAVLETAMQGLALDARHPVALELAATSTSRQFLLRATSTLAQQHLAAQVQARYPQASIQPVATEDDPLQVRAGEAVSVVELRPGAAAYLPLRNWRERELDQEGADPLLGVLAAFTAVPPRMRVVAQLALVPASPTWSQSYQRKAVEHPLEQERVRTRREQSGQDSGPGTLQLVGMGVLVVLLLVWWRLQQQVTARIPPWMLQAGTSLVHGRMPALSSGQLALVEGVGLTLVVVCFGLAFVVLQVKSRTGGTPIYDMRLVGEKTARPAYRVRLRLFVFAAISARVTPLPVQQEQEVSRPWFTHLWWELKRRYAHWRAQWQEERQHRQARLDVLAPLCAAYRQYHTAAGGYFVPRCLSARSIRHVLEPDQQRWSLCVGQRGWTNGLRRSAHLLSVADVAALWHLPQTQDLADLPYVERGRARTLLAPVTLTQGDGTRIGTSRHAGHDVPVFLPQECLRHNLLAVASTGKGKSTLFQHLAGAVLTARATVRTVDVEERAQRDGLSRESGMSLAFIEPHGDVIAALLGRIPAPERDNVVLVDLANAASPVGLNPLDMVGKDRDKVVDNLITLAEHLWESSYGSRTENVLEYALKTLADVNELLIAQDPQQGPDQQYTLLDVVPLLRQTSFRHALFAQVRDEMLLDWWQHYYEPMDAHQQREVTSSVITKLSKFASSRRARRILGQPRSTLDLNTIIRSGQLLLVSTASGVVGADLSELIGIVLLGLFEAALAEQATLVPEARQRYLVLIDEFQVYRGANYQTMLAELRKYGDSFALATQSLSYLDRLDRTLRSTVLANIDHLFAFHMAGEDARLLHELDGIAEDDITNLDDFQCYVKLSLGGRRLPVFSLALDAPPPSDGEVATAIRLRSQQRDTRPAAMVDEILRQSRVRQQTATAKPSRTSRGRGQLAAQTEVEQADQHLEESDRQVSPSDSMRKRHKRGGRTRTPADGTVPAVHVHMMYDEQEQEQETAEEQDGQDEQEEDVGDG